MFWAQLTTPDPDAAAQFYASLFGWTVDMDDTGPGLPRGAFFLPDAASGTLADSVAGLQPMSRWQQQKGESARWTPFLHTPDVVAMTERAQFHGATLVEPAMPARGDGWRALLADPTGATYGVWEPADDRSPSARSPAPPSTSSGALVWSELQTPDPYAARDYYCELMAWSTDDPNENPDFIAEDVCFLRNGSPLGRLREVRPSDVPDAPRWLPGFSVDSLRDATERASGLGATVSDVRAAIEGEQPPVALLTDPAGASCLLVE